MVQFLLPTGSALVLGDGGISAWCLAGSGLALFWSHEALAVLLGHRGRRRQREEGARAWRWMGVLVVVALGLAALALGHGDLVPWLLAPSLVLGGAALGFLVRRQERSTLAQVVAAAALSSVSLPVAVLGGVEISGALALWGSWLASFFAATVAVRSVIEQWTPLQRGLGLVLGALLGPLVLLAAQRAWSLPSAALWAALPPILVVTIIGLVRPGARRIHQLGWTLALASTVQLLVLIWGIPR